VGVGGMAGWGAVVLETISAELLHSETTKLLAAKFSFFYKISLFNFYRNTSSPSSAGYTTGCLLENSSYLQILLTREKGRAAICYST
jgi:hypothetical protein